MYENECEEETFGQRNTLGSAMNLIGYGCDIQKTHQDPSK